MPPHPRYDRLSVWLHWLMAALLLAQWALGWWMTGIPKDGTGARAWWFNLHKSLGLALLALLALRMGWALLRPRVAALPQRPALQRLARGAHRALYALMLLVPLAGLLGSVFSGYPVRFFGLRLPLPLARWDAAKEWLSAVHHWSAWALLALVALHVAAFAHHQFVLRERLLQRMA